MGIHRTAGHPSGYKPWEESLLVFNYCIWCVLFSVAVTVLSLCCLSPVLLPYVAFRGHVACLNFNLTGASEVECILTDLH